jgi:hypothetical protein
LIDDLIAHGVARLVPIDGSGRDKLLKSTPAVAANRIAAGTYRGTGAIESVSVHAVWIVNAREPDYLIYGITRALFDPGNRAALDGGDESTAQIRLETATAVLPAPLHPGAARFFREVGQPAKPNLKTGKN